MFLKTSRIFHSLIALTFFGIFGQVQAAEWSGPNATELLALPPFCEAKLNEKSPQRETWARIIGPMFGSVHHYCFALNFMNRHYKTSGPEKGTWLHFAIDDFNYMLKSNPGLASPIVPEMYLNRGTALRLAGRMGESFKDYYKALELNPKLSRAYVEISDYLNNLKQADKALEIITTGLRHLPDDKSLQKRYSKYGGKLPYPEPLVKKEEPPAPTQVVNKDIKVGELKAAVDTKTGLTPVAPIPPSSVTPSPATDKPMSVKDQSQQPAQGSGKNPWCRFCP